MERFQQIAADKATTMGHIKRQHLTEAKVFIPKEPLLKVMDKTLQPLIDKQISNNLESNILTNIRDTLLPKLLSGELRIKEAEKLAGEIA